MYHLDLNLNNSNSNSNSDATGDGYESDVESISAPRHWSNLDRRLLQRIAGYLPSQHDCSNFSMVCKEWSIAGEPALWSYPKFYTPQQLEKFLGIVSEYPYVYGPRIQGIRFTLATHYDSHLVSPFYCEDGQYADSELLTLMEVAQGRHVLSTDPAIMRNLLLGSDLLTPALPLNFARVCSPINSLSIYGYRLCDKHIVNDLMQWRLQELEIIGMPGKHLQSFNHLLYSLHDLQSLRIESDTPLSADTWGPLAMRLPTLRKLRIWAPGIEDSQMLRAVTTKPARHLEVLHLVGCGNNISEDFIARIVNGSPRINSLAVHSTRIGDSSAVAAAALCGCPNLVHLELVGDEHSSTNVSVEPQPVVASKLATLCLTNINVDSSLIQSAASVMTRLRTLHIRGAANLNGYSVGQLLRVSANIAAVGLYECPCLNEDVLYGLADGSGVRFLKVLLVQNCAIQSEGVESTLSSFPNLKRLSISGAEKIQQYFSYDLDGSADSTPSVRRAFKPEYPSNHFFSKADPPMATETIPFPSEEKDYSVIPKQSFIPGLVALSCNRDSLVHRSESRRRATASNGVDSGMNSISQSPMVDSQRDRSLSEQPTELPQSPQPRSSAEYSEYADAVSCEVDDKNGQCHALVDAEKLDGSEAHSTFAAATVGTVERVVDSSDQVQEQAADTPRSTDSGSGRDGLEPQLVESLPLDPIPEASHIVEGILSEPQLLIPSKQLEEDTQKPLSVSCPDMPVDGSADLETNHQADTVDILPVLEEDTQKEVVTSSLSDISSKQSIDREVSESIELDRLSSELKAQLDSAFDRSTDEVVEDPPDTTKPVSSVPVDKEPETATRSLEPLDIQLPNVNQSNEPIVRPIDRSTDEVARDVDDSPVIAKPVSNVLSEEPSAEIRSLEVHDIQLPNFNQSSELVVPSLEADTSTSEREGHVSDNATKEDPVIPEPIGHIEAVFEQPSSDPVEITGSNDVVVEKAQADVAKIADETLIPLGSVETTGTSNALVRAEEPTSRNVDIPDSLEVNGTNGGEFTEEKPDDAKAADEKPALPDPVQKTGANEELAKEEQSILPDAVDAVGTRNLVAGEEEPIIPEPVGHIEAAVPESTDSIGTSDEVTKEEQPDVKVANPTDVQPTQVSSAEATGVSEGLAKEELFTPSDSFDATGASGEVISEKEPGSGSIRTISRDSVKTAGVSEGLAKEENPVVVVEKEQVPSNPIDVNGANEELVKEEKPVAVTQPTGEQTILPGSVKETGASNELDKEEKPAKPEPLGHVEVNGASGEMEKEEETTSRSKGPMQPGSVETKEVDGFVVVEEEQASRDVDIPDSVEATDASGEAEKEKQSVETKAADKEPTPSDAVKATSTRDVIARKEELPMPEPIEHIKSLESGSVEVSGTSGEVVKEEPTSRSVESLLSDSAEDIGAGDELVKEEKPESSGHIGAISPASVEATDPSDGMVKKEEPTSRNVDILDTRSPESIASLNAAKEIPGLVKATNEDLLVPEPVKIAADSEQPLLGQQSPERPPANVIDWFKANRKSESDVADTPVLLAEREDHQPPIPVDSPAAFTPRLPSIKSTAEPLPTLATTMDPARLFDQAIAASHRSPDIVSNQADSGFTSRSDSKDGTPLITLATNVNGMSPFIASTSLDSSPVRALDPSPRSGPMSIPASLAEETDPGPDSPKVVGSIEGAGADPATPIGPSWMSPQSEISYNRADSQLSIGRHGLDSTTPLEQPRPSTATSMSGRDSAIYMEDMAQERSHSGSTTTPQPEDQVVPPGKPTSSFSTPAFPQYFNHPDIPQQDVVRREVPRASGLGTKFPLTSRRSKDTVIELNIETPNDGRQILQLKLTDNLDDKCEEFCHQHGMIDLLPGMKSLVRGKAERRIARRRERALQAAAQPGGRYYIK